LCAQNHRQTPLFIFTGFFLFSIGSFGPSIENASTTPQFRCIFASSTFQTKKMKTKSTIIAAILTITTTILFAENDIVSNRIANENTSASLAAIAPVTPIEATFEEVSTVIIDFATLAPSMPLEADFSDAIPVIPTEASFEDVCTSIIDLAILAPSLPLEADFSDAAPAANIDMTILAPAAPVEADFNDSVEISVDINALAPSTPFVAEFE
jgi:hypothetical protein